MKKNFVAGILAAAMAVTTIGCSGKSNGNTKPTPTPGGDAYVPTPAEQNTPLVFGIDGADYGFLRRRNRRHDADRNAYLRRRRLQIRQ